MADQQWLPPESQWKFRQGIGLVLSKWSLLQDFLNEMLKLTVESLKFDISRFLCRTHHNRVDDVASMLRNAVQDSVNAVLPYSNCKEVAEELLTAYKELLLEKQSELAKGNLWPSQHWDSKLRDAVELSLYEWSKLQRSINEFRCLQTSELIEDIFTFFSINAVPDVDALALRMNIFFFNILRYLVGSPQYFKKVAQQLITLHQDCLEGNFRANKFLREARNPTQVAFQAVKKGRQVYAKKRQRIRRSRNRAN